MIFFDTADRLAHGNARRVGTLFIRRHWRQALIQRNQIFLGSLVTYFVERRHGVVDAEDSVKERVHRPGTLFSAGLITGEALTGILIAIPIVVSGSADVLALPAGLHFGQVVGLVVFAVVGWLLYRSAARGHA